MKICPKSQRTIDRDDLFNCSCHLCSSFCHRVCIYPKTISEVLMEEMEKEAEKP